jgi:hypothetical protein
VSNNTLQWTADEPDPQRGYCGHHAYARVGNYAISPSVSFGSLVRHRVSYMPTGTVMESRTIGHYRSLKEAKAAAQRDHDQTGTRDDEPLVRHVEYLKELPDFLHILL